MRSSSTPCACARISISRAGWPSAARCLLELTRKGLSREGAYALVQRHAMETWDHGGDFRERVLADPKISEVLSKEEIDRAFSLDEALRHVEAIFRRAQVE